MRFLNEIPPVGLEGCSHAWAHCQSGSFASNKHLLRLRKARGPELALELGDPRLERVHVGLGRAGPSLGGARHLAGRAVLRLLMFAKKWS